jgi:hypothetical protein
LIRLFSILFLLFRGNICFAVLGERAKPSAQHVSFGHPGFRVSADSLQN